MKGKKDTRNSLTNTFEILRGQGSEGRGGDREVKM